MSKPEWTKIGTVEVCVGTDGVTGVWNGKVCHAIIPCGDYVYRDTKEYFEAIHCQPQKPRHIIRECADGSCVVESVEQDEQGRPLRCAMLSKPFDSNGYGYRWIEMGNALSASLRCEDAMPRAVYYVETGE